MKPYLAYPLPHLFLISKPSSKVLSKPLHKFLFHLHKRKTQKITTNSPLAISFSSKTCGNSTNALKHHKCFHHPHDNASTLQPLLIMPFNSCSCPCLLSLRKYISSNNYPCRKPSTPIANKQFDYTSSIAINHQANTFNTSLYANQSANSQD